VEIDDAKRNYRHALLSVKPAIFEGLGFVALRWASDGVPVALLIGALDVLC